MNRKCKFLIVIFEIYLVFYLLIPQKNTVLAYFDSNAASGIYSITWDAGGDEIGLGFKIKDVLLNGTEAEKIDYLQVNHSRVSIIGLNLLWNYLNPTDPLDYPSYSPSDPLNPAYDWRIVDESINIAQKFNKRILIRIIGGLNKKYTPDWVWTKGGFNWIEYDHNGKTLAVPSIWEPIFQQRWGNFIKAFGKRYNSNPRIQRVGINIHAYEMFFIREKDIFQRAINELGFTATQYRNAFMWNAQNFNLAFPDKPLFKDLSEVVDISSADIDAAISDPIEREAVKKLQYNLATDLISLFGNRLYLQSDGLHGSGAVSGYGGTYFPNPTLLPSQITNQFSRLAILYNNSNTNLMGFETMMPGRNGDFDELVDVALGWPARYVGIFTKDLASSTLAAAIDRLYYGLEAKRNIDISPPSPPTGLTVE